MGAYELNEVCRQHVFRKGEVSNPTGYNGTKWRRMKSSEIKTALWAELDEPCGVPGLEHLTKFQYAIRNIVARFMEADKFATKFVVERLFGRVPYDIKV